MKTRRFLALLLLCFSVSTVAEGGEGLNANVRKAHPPVQRAHDPFDGTDEEDESGMTDVDSLGPSAGVTPTWGTIDMQRLRQDARKVKATRDQARSAVAPRSQRHANTRGCARPKEIKVKRKPL